LHIADMNVACYNQYATIVLVPLDGETNQRFGKRLLRVSMLGRPAVWDAPPSCARISGKQTN
jgi:hypothetical protein